MPFLLARIIGGGSGEANTISAVGSAGVSLVEGKSGVDLQVRKINALSSKLSIALDAANQKVDLDVVQANIDHNALSNFVSAQHVDHSAVSISSGTGLTGGGTIAASRTLSLANTAVTAGSYTRASFTVDAQGRLTAASSNAAPTIEEISDTNLQTFSGTTNNYGDLTNMTKTLTGLVSTDYVLFALSLTYSCSSLSDVWAIGFNDGTNDLERGKIYAGRTASDGDRHQNTFFYLATGFTGTVTFKGRVKLQTPTAPGGTFYCKARRLYVMKLPA